MPGGALMSLRSLTGSMTPALERIAQYVLHNADQVIYQTVIEVADAAGSSEASVVRFCRDLGFQGFQDFKLALASDLVTSPVILPKQEKPTSAQSTADYVYNTARQVLDETRRLMNVDLLEEVVERILKARRIDFYGVGNAGTTAQDFAQKLQRLGCAAIAYPDPHSAAVSAATLGPKDLAFGISVSGSSIDTVKALEQAKLAGAYTVAVTRGARSPITRFADTVLLTSAPESPLTRGSMGAKISQLMLLDFLFTRTALRHPKGAELLSKTAAAVADRSY